jgi:hypothetical protein
MSEQSENWKVEYSTNDQRKLFNAACGDLSAQIKWHGFKLSKDDWRHMLSGTVMGWRMMPGIDKGEGTAAGLIMLGGSSLDLTKRQCTEAIELAFLIGDHPQGQGLEAEPVKWCAVVCLARFVAEEVKE